MKSTTISLLTSAILATGVFGQQAAAQSAPRFEARPFIGAYVPTGDQGDLLDAAATFGAQGSFAVTRRIAVLGTASWTPSAMKQAPTSEDGLDVFQYDLGGEFKQPITLANGMTVAPFIGAGIGGRTYSYRDDAMDTETNLSGYGALGGQLQVGAIGLRLEARDYVSRYKGLQGELRDAKARNDLSFVTAISIPL